MTSCCAVTSRVHEEIWIASLYFVKKPKQTALLEGNCGASDTEECARRFDMHSDVLVLEESVTVLTEAVSKALPYMYTPKHPYTIAHDYQYFGAQT